MGRCLPVIVACFAAVGCSNAQPTAGVVAQAASAVAPGGQTQPAAPATGAGASRTAETGGDVQVATFASGCFWCTESDFDKVAGVVSTTSGYTGGHLRNPSYEQVSTGGTGHVESVEVRYDPSKVTYEQLLDTYWHNVDPFVSRGQFCDFGEQYRPVIVVRGAAQRAAAEASRKGMQGRFSRRIVVAIEDAGVFYPAEDYHQDFHVKSATRYNYYRWGCGRDARLADIWKSAR